MTGGSVAASSLLGQRCGGNLASPERSGERGEQGRGLAKWRGGGHGYDQPSRGQRRHGYRGDNNPTVVRDVFKSIYLRSVSFFLLLIAWTR